MALTLTLLRCQRRKALSLLRGLSLTGLAWVPWPLREPITGLGWNALIGQVWIMCPLQVGTEEGSPPRKTRVLWEEKGEWIQSWPKSEVTWDWSPLPGASVPL